MHAFVTSARTLRLARRLARLNQGGLPINMVLSMRHDALHLLHWYCKHDAFTADKRVQLDNSRGFKKGYVKVRG